MRRQSAFVAVLGLALLSVGEARAGAGNELRELYRGPRPTAMANAYTAVADDESAVFMNPAGMANITRPRLQLTPLTLELATDIVTSLASSLSSFNSFSGDTLNTLIGKDLFVHGQMTPTLVMPNFGVGLLLDQQIAFYGRNKSLPEFTVGYQTTNGIQVAGGLNLVRNKNSKTQVNLGAGAKVLWRRGGYRKLDVTQLFNLSPAILEDIKGEFTRGQGLDLGVQVIHHFNSRLDFMVGSAWTEINGITFEGTSDPQPGNLSLGLAARYRLPLSSVTLSYDNRHMLDEVDARRRHHLGLEVSIPMISAYGGYSEGYLTYGAALDFWLLKFLATSYVAEMGALSDQLPQRRWLIQINLGIGL